MRRAIAVVVALLGSAATPALAQDGPLTIESRALDYSEMLRKQHGRSAETPEPIPLAERPISAVVRTPGARSRSVPGEGESVVTDADGRFRMELGELGPGATVHFFVEAGAAGEDGGAGHYARPWEVDGGEPLEDVRFFEVSTDGRGVRQQVMQVVTAVDEGDLGAGDVGQGNAIQIRHLAFVQNLSFGVWLGDLASGQPVSFSIPVPKGFELRDVRVDGQRVEPIISSTPHGGASFVYRDALFPTVPGDKEAYMFSAVLVGPYEDGEVVDISWHTDMPIDDYRVSLETPTFTYEPGDGEAALQDAGEQPPMGNTPKATHAWAVQGVPAHADLPVRFRVGRPFPTRAVLTTLIILLAAVGAALLGRSLGRRGHGATTIATTGAAPTPGEAVADLDARLERGEITSIEHEVRRRAALAPATPPPAASGTPPAPARASAERLALLAKLDEIVRRAPDASLEQLRDDVRALARAVRETLEG